MANQAFELAILISLKDAASAGADRVSDRLRNMGKEGKNALKEFEALRKDFQRGLVLGGVGIAGLQVLKNGAKVAGDFESALTELRLSIEETGKSGAVDLGKLNDQMNRFEHLGTKLGNQLPGTTKDFIDMFVALKQGGLATETILKGAGEQVAYLSVLTHSVPKELATAFAEVGEQFQLKPEEYAPSVENFIKNFRAVGLRPEDLIEGTKFAQLRGGLPLGLQGLSGLESMSSLLGVLKMSGLKGGVGGREAAALLLALVPTSREQKKIDKELHGKGIDLQFFDKQGQFLGIDNLIGQLEKLRKLSPQKSEELIKKRFGETALGPIAALSKMGMEGLEKYQQRAQSVSSVQSQLNELTETYNQKVEALEGTLENLKATAFTPLLSELKPLVDVANNAVGALQGFSKANPTLTKTATDLLLIGSAATLLGGAIMSLRAKYYMWKMAIALGSGEKGVLDFLGNARRGADEAAVAVERNASTWKSAGRKLGAAFGAGLTVAAADWYINKLFEEKSNVEEAKNRAFAAGQRLGDMILDGLKQQIEGKLGGDELGKLYRLKAQEQAEERAKSLGIDDTTSSSEFNRRLAISIGDSYLKEHDYLRWWDSVGADVFPGRRYPTKEKSEEYIISKLVGSSFARPEQLLAMLGKAREVYGKAEQPEMFVELKRLAEEAYPQWRQQIESGDASVGELKNASDEATKSLFVFSTNLLAFRPPSFTFGKPPDLPVKPLIGGQIVPVVSGKPVVAPRKREFHFEKMATGGFIESEGLVHLHPGERVIPARVTRGVKNGAPGADGGLVNHGGIHLHVHVPRGSRAAEEPEAFSEYVLKSVTRKVLRQRERR